MRGLYAAGEGAVGEARGNGVAWGEFAHGANQRSVICEHEGVAAVEDGKRREGVKLRVHGAEAGG